MTYVICAGRVPVFSPCADESIGFPPLNGGLRLLLKV